MRQPIRLIVCMLILWGLAAAAVAAPQDVMLVLDNSGSMRKNDPDHLAAAAVKDFIDRQANDTRVGLIVFASRPDLLSGLTPLTDDRSGLRADLRKLDYSGRYTDTASALERALYELRMNGREGAAKSIILMTDGIIDTGSAASDDEKTRWLEHELAPSAKQLGVRVFGVAFTEKADYQLLQSLAHLTGGDYYRAFQARDIDGVLRHISEAISNPATVAAADESGADSGAASTPFRDTASTPPERIVYVPQKPVAAAQPAAEPIQPAPAASGSHGRAWLVTLLLAALVLGSGAWLVYRRRPKAVEALGRALHIPGVSGPARAVLYDVEVPADIKRYDLTEDMTVIGRIPGQEPRTQYVIVAEPTVGRRHATIERRGQSYWIRDEGSVNGTFVNGSRISGEQALKHGDMIRIHRREFEFVQPEFFDSDKTLIAAVDSLTQIGETGQQGADVDRGTTIGEEVGK